LSFDGSISGTLKTIVLVKEKRMLRLTPFNWEGGSNKAVIEKLSHLFGSVISR